MGRKNVVEFVYDCEKHIQKELNEIDKISFFNSMKVLNAFHDNNDTSTFERRIKMEFRVYGLDVWENEEYGYTVNDVFQTDIVLKLSEGLKDSEILSQLRQYYNLPRVTIDGDEFTLYIDSAKEGKPLLELRRQY